MIIPIIEKKKKMMMMMIFPQIVACCLLPAVLMVAQQPSVVSSFSISFPSPPSATLISHRMITTTSLFMGTGIGRPSKKKTKKRKKNKPSMAERLKRRQNKARGVNDGGQHVSPYAGLPKTVLDSQKPKKEKSEDSGDSTKSKGISDDGPIHVESPKAAGEKAKELLRAQRQSVNMLTFVKEQIDEQLTSPSSNLLWESLETNGYAVIDDFLASKNDISSSSSSSSRSSENGEDDKKRVDGTIILPELEKEVEQMMTTTTTKPISSPNEENDELSTPISVPMMEIDPLNIGSGEYLTSIKGGEEQYTVCPRIVEFVVSSTRNIPEACTMHCENDHVRDNNQESASKPSFSLSLDPSACMATLRCFDRNALMASLSLLTGTDDDSVLDDAYKNASYDVTAKDGVDDKRRLSLYYFIVPETWNTSDGDDDDNSSTTRDGGGFTFEATGEMVLAKRDRLILVLSDKTKCKKIPWKGSSSSTSPNTIASAIELHLIEKRE